MAPPIIVGEKPQPASGGAPVKQAAAQRVQRLWNPRTAKMEAMGPHGHLVGNEQFHRPPPPGHQVSHTQTKVTRETTPGAKPAVSFINMSPSEIEARARAITQAEIKGARGPFKEQLGLLGQEQTGALQTNTQAYGKLGETIGNQQTAQQASAKTFENYAADAVTKAAQAAPGAQQTAERLGLKPGQQLPESARNQQEAARTLLSGIAQSSQAGTTARQQSEEQFLANMKATATQGGVETGRAIEGQFGKQKADVLGKEAAEVAKLQSMGPNLAQRLFGEQEKLKIAAGGLGVKEQQLGINAFKANTTANYQQGRLAEGGKKLALKGREFEVKTGQKNTELELKAKKGDREAQALLSKLKTEEGRRGEIEAKTAKLLGEIGPGGGKPLTTAELNGVKGEAAKIFALMQEGREKGRPLSQVRNEIIHGSARREYQATSSSGKKYWKPYTEHLGTFKNPILIQVALESINTGYVSAGLKQQLREAGLPDHGWSNLLYKGAGKTRPASPPGTLGITPILPPPKR